MSIQNETEHAGAFIVSEANGTRSREIITIASGNNLLAGAVLGKVTASDEYVDLDPAASDGSEVAAGVLFADADATDADLKAVAVVRDAEVKRSALVFATAVTAPQRAAAIQQLAALGLIAR